jgi:hypothetical protein
MRSLKKISQRALALALVGLPIFGGCSSALDAEPVDGSAAADAQSNPDCSVSASADEAEIGAVTQALGSGTCGAVPVIPVYLHMIITAQEGLLLPPILDRVVDDLNRIFDTQSLGKRYRFVKGGLEYTQDPAWFNMVVNPGSSSPSAEERAAKHALHQGGRTALNIYVGKFVDSIGRDVPGSARFPWQLASDLERDGVMLRTGYLTTNALIHEVGHWLGLYHVYENGCTTNGDGVADTPAQLAPLSSCSPSDSCPDLPGVDPVTNFMNVVGPDPACLNVFTNGQRTRIDAQHNTNRCDQFEGAQLDIDRVGGDLTNFASTDARACRDSCIANSSCRAFTFTGTRCYLKNAVPNPTLAPGMRSGIVRGGVENGYVRVGIEAGTSTRDEATCRSVCLIDDRCQAFSFVASSGACLLKQAASSPVPSTGTRSQLLREAGLEYGVDRPGQDYTSLWLSQPNPYQCQQTCAADPQCRAFTYVEPGLQGVQAKCYLKNGVPSAGIASGVISGKIR